MFADSTRDAEPPQCSYSDDNAAASMLAAHPPGPETHAVVIGRHTLHPVIALMRSGCASVEAHGLQTPPTHLDPASLAWIADITTQSELEAAVHDASGCLSAEGHMVLDVTDLASPTVEATARHCLAKAGFILQSVFHQGRRLILVATSGCVPALAA
ncbi:MAG: hypothetical protein ACYCZX_02565 [Rhodospirillaceae bacterium]